MFSLGWFYSFKMSSWAARTSAGPRTSVDDRGLIHSQLDKKKLCYICHGKVQCILAEQRNGVFSNLSVNFQGTCDDGIQLNMTINWKDRLEVNWQGLLLSRLNEYSPGLFKYISCENPIRIQFHSHDFVKRTINSISGLSIIFSGFVLGRLFSFGTLQD